MAFKHPLNLFIYPKGRNADEGDIYLFNFSRSFFVSGLCFCSNLLFTDRRLLIVAVQDLTAPFADLLDRRIGFLDTVLYFQWAFRRSGGRKKKGHGGGN